MNKSSTKIQPARRFARRPTLVQLTAMSEAFRKSRATRPQRPDKVKQRPDVKPFIVKIISTHKRAPRPGMKRIQCVVKMLGLTKTMHVDVPSHFSI